MKVEQVPAKKADGFRCHAGARQHDAGIPGYSAGEKLIDRTTQTSGNQWRRRAGWQVYQPVVAAATSGLGSAASRALCIKLHGKSFNMRLHWHCCQSVKKGNIATKTLNITANVKGRVGACLDFCFCCKLIKCLIYNYLY